VGPGLVARESELTVRSRLALWRIFLLPGVIWLTALFVVPLGLVVAVSLARTNIVGLPDYGFNLGNFRQVFQSYYLPVIIRTLVYALSATAVILLLAYPTAYTIARFGGRFRNALIVCVVLPWFVDYLVRIYAWVVILGNNGLANGILHGLGMHGSPPVQFLNRPWAVIGGLVYSYFPFMVLPIYAALEQMDGQLIEAGRDLYGTGRQTFWHVTLPVTRPGVIAGVVLTLLPCLGDFATAQLLGGSSTYMVGNLIADQFGNVGDITFGSALTVVVMSALLVVIAGYLWRTARRARQAPA
jgi:spermidine/putrescine transport system permease protein